VSDQPSHHLTFFRFLLVGGTVSLIFSATTAGLIRFADTPAFATSVIVYLLCIPAAFAAHKRFAFGVRQARRTAFLIYLATQVCSLSLVAAITTRYVTHVLWRDTALLLLTSAAAAVISYLIGRYITFAPER
jgi:putative flippase GtrA